MNSGGPLPGWRGIAIGMVIGLIVSSAAIWIVFLATKSNAGLVAPQPAGTPPIVANPTWTNKVFSVVSSGAAAANFTVYMSLFGPSRLVRMIADPTTSIWTSNDFLLFPPATFNGSDLPAMDTVNDYFYQTVDATCLFDPVDVADCKMLVFVDGSALIGMKSFGISGPWVQMGVFDASLIGHAFKVNVQLGEWVTTFNAGPAVNAQVVNPNTTAPVTAADFDSRYLSVHGITPRVTSPTPTTFVR